MHIVDIAHGARLVKTLIQGGHYSRAASGIEVAPSWPARDFVHAFLLGSGNGAFVVAELITRVVNDEEALEERVYLKAVFDEKIVNEIQAKKPKGLDVLLEQLRKL
jgi:pumilio family protein 6